MTNATTPRRRIFTDGWLLQARAEAFSRFLEAEAPPRWAETWRRMPFEAWRLDALRGPEECARVLCGSSGPEGAVEILSLEEAAEAYPDIVGPHAGAMSAGPDFDKHEAANLALWRGGVFVRVRKGTRLEEPVRLTLSADAAGPYSFPRVLVVVEEGGEASIIEEHVGTGSGEHSSTAFSTLVAEEGSRVRYFYTQELPGSAVHFWHQSASLCRDARLEHFSVLTGGKLHKSELKVSHMGPGARSEIRGVVLGRGEQAFDPHTKQLHPAPYTASDLDYRAALTDKARAVYTGLIRIEKEAPGCDAYQQNRNLLLSDEARADSTPVLEIFPDNVRCTHGAAAGPLDAGELFYLAARGIPEPEAARMLVKGFFDPVLSKVPEASVRRRIERRIEGAAAA